jgi:hypothetical protein
MMNNLNHVNNLEGERPREPPEQEKTAPDDE